jgi:hypothetical protein
MVSQLNEEEVYKSWRELYPSEVVNKTLKSGQEVMFSLNASAALPYYILRLGDHEKRPLPSPVSSFEAQDGKDKNVGLPEVACMQIYFKDEIQAEDLAEIFEDLAKAARKLGKRVKDYQRKEGLVTTR